MSTINIAGLDHAEVLAALFNNSRQQGIGFMHTEGRTDMGVWDAREILKQGSYFDYLRGRVMKIRIEDNLEPRLYDRDNGPGAAERAIAPLRARTPSFATTKIADKRDDSPSFSSPAAWPFPVGEVITPTPAPEPAFASGSGGDFGGGGASASWGDSSSSSSDYSSSSSSDSGSSGSSSE